MRKAARAVLKKIYIESNESEKPIGATPEEMREWNAEGKYPKYTKREYAQADGCDAYEIRLWNAEGNMPKFTKEEHKEADGLTGFEMRKWNMDGNENNYTQEEYAALTKQNSDDAEFKKISRYYGMN